ncbi:MAG: hypothetical protein U5K69_20235 [Balneolaceae bacterium]|nr:hypothetical protein [Balneolaceae bacterium]
MVRSFPMMAEYRVVVLRDFGSLGDPTASDNGGVVNDLIPYLKQPNPTTLLVMFDTQKPHGRSKIGKAIRNNKKVGYYNFKEVPDYRLPDWIIEWTQREFDKKITTGAAQMLAQFVGNNLQLVSTEIDKVCTFVDTAEKVKENDVKEIIGLYREYGAIELKDALLSRDLEQSLFIAEQMLQHSKTNTGEIIRTVGGSFTVCFQTFGRSTSCARVTPRRKYRIRWVSAIAGTSTNSGKTHRNMSFRICLAYSKPCWTPIALQKDFHPWIPRRFSLLIKRIIDLFFFVGFRR